MPVLVVKVEGRGNGIKTVVTNLSAISTALTRPPAYAAKFFGFELGALTFIDAKIDRYGYYSCQLLNRIE
jgi:translation initiation factor 5